MLRILLAIFIFAVTLSAEQYSLNKFTGGLNTRISPVLLPEGSTPDCQNVLFDDTGGVKKRKGYKYIGYSSSTIIGARLYPLSRASGAKFLFKQAEGELWVSVTGVSWTLLRSDLRWQVNPLNSAVISDKRWFVNGIDYIFSSNGRTYDEYTFIKRGKFITSKAEGSSGILYDRVFVANTYDFPSGVYYSDLAYAPDSSAAWPEGQIFLVGASDGEVITGLYVWKGDLYIFKTRSVWRLAGNSPDNWVLRRLTREYGCAEQGTIKEYQNILVFLSNEKRAVVGFDGSFFKELSESIEPDLDGWDNLDGYYNYWIQTVQSDFNMGVSTGLLVSDYLTLDDVSKVWSSSNTYPTAFSTITAVVPFSTSSFVGTEIVNDSVRLTKVNVSTDTAVMFDDDFSIALFMLQNNQSYDLDFSGKYSLIDKESNKLTTKSEFLKIIGITWVVPDGVFHIGVNPGPIYNTFTFTFDVEDSSKPLTYCEYKFNVEVKERGAQNTDFGTFNYTALDKIKFGIEITVQGNEEGTWVDWGSKEHIISQDKTDYEYYMFSNYWGYLYKLIEGKGENKVIDGTDENRIVFSNPKATDRIRFIVKFAYITQAELIWRVTWNLRPQYWYQIEVGGDYDVTPQHKSTGTYITEIHDVSCQVYLSTAIIDVDLPVGTTALFAIRSSSWSSVLAGATYYAFANGDALPSQLSPCQYIQVRSSFSAKEISVGISSYTPTLHLIKIGAVKSTGSWESDWFQADKVAGWKYSVFDDETPANTGISYAARTASSTVTQSSASWDWLVSGDLLSATLHPSSHTYIQVKSTMATTNGIRIPTMFSTTFLWYPESEPIRPCAEIVDKRYWLGVSTYTGYNENIYILDKNMVWARYSGYTPADIVNWKNETYILDSSTSAIWQANYGSADRWKSATSSSTIEAFWTSKPLFLSLNKETTLNFLYSSLSATGGDVKVGFALYPDDFTEHTITVSGTREINDRKSISTGEMGKVWQFRIYDDSVEGAFQLNNFTIFHTPKPLR